MIPPIGIAMVQAVLQSMQSLLCISQYVQCQLIFIIKLCDYVYTYLHYSIQIPTTMNYYQISHPLDIVIHLYDVYIVSICY